MSAVAVVSTELFKSTRRLRTYVAYGIVCLIPVIMTVAIKLNPPDRRRTAASSSSSGRSRVS